MCVVALASPPVQANADPPRLILQITIDGIRADLLERYSDRFGSGGFRRLIDTGFFGSPDPDVPERRDGVNHGQLMASHAGRSSTLYLSLSGPQKSKTVLLQATGREI